MAERDGSVIIDLDLNPKEFNASIGDIKKGLSGVSRTLGTLKTNMDKAFSGNQGAVKSFQTKAKALEGTISELKTKFEEVGTAHVESSELTELNKEIDKVRTAWAKLMEKREKQEALGVDEFSKGWESLSYEIEKTKENLDELRSARQRLFQEGGAYTSGVDTTQYAEIAQKLREAEAEYDRLKTKGQELNDITRQFSGFSAKSLSDAFRQAMPLADQIRGRFEQIKGAFQSMGQGISFAFHHPLQALSQLLGSVKNAAQYAGKALLKAFGAGVKRLISSVGNAIKNAAKRLASFKKSAGDAGNGISGLLKKFSGLGNMLKRMLTRRFLMGIINGAKEGIQNLAQASPAFNAAMSSLKSSLTGMKNSFASAFGSILPIVLPVLQTLINWLSTAANYIAMFFAALSGAKTFKKATEVQEDYAASLNNTASAAKEAKNELLGFDKITKLQDDSSSGGGGGGGISPSDMFEDAEIDSSIADFVKKLKEAWEAEDFTEVGQIIGTKLNEMVSKIDELVSWDNVGDKITTWINNIGEVFNSLMDTVDWENIGKTVADGLNTITNALEVFVDSFDLEKLGTALSETINGFDKNVDWENLGETVSKGLNEITKSINNFVDGTNWRNVGSDIADSVNTAITGIDSKELGKTLSAKVKIAFETLGAFVQKFNWGEAGVKIGETINAWFDNINWGQLGNDLSKAFSGTFDTLSTALETIDWMGLAEKTIDFLKGVDWSQMAQSFFRAIGNALAGITEYLGTLIGEAFIAMDDYFTPYIDEAGGDVIKGLWNGIKAAFGNAWQWLKENIFDPFIEGFKKLFGINSPSTVMAEMGGYLIDGLKEGLSGIWNKIKEKFSEFMTALVEWFGEKWENFKNLGIKIISNIKSGVGNVWGTIKEKFSEFMTSLVSWFGEKWESFKNIGTKIISNLKSGIGNIWNTIKEKFSAFWTKTKEWFSTIFEKFKSYGGSIVDKLRAGIGDMWSKIKDKFTALWDKIKSFWSGKSIVNTTVSVYHEREGRTKVERAAKGGIFSRPTHVYLGENGPEAVIPLKNNTEWIDTVSKYVVNHIPHYATGNVIPANFGRYFAILGDNKKEPEVVSPLSTMKQAVKEALLESGLVGGSDTQNISLNIHLDGNVIYNDVVRINRQRTRMGGANPLVV